MSPLLPCERCRQPVELRQQRWTRRRLPERGGRLSLVCGECEAELAAREDLELEALARAGVQVDRAVRSRLTAARRVETPFRRPGEVAA